MRSNNALVLNAAVAAAALALGIGCGSDNEELQPPPPPPNQVATPTPTPVNPQASTTPSSPSLPQKIQIPGLGEISLNPSNQQGGNSGSSGQQGQGLQIPGMPGLKLPFPTGNTKSGNSGSSGQPAARRDPPARGSLSPANSGSYNGQGHLTRAFMSNRALEIHRSLIGSLTGSERTQAGAIPIRVVDNPRQPNAAAGCTKASNQPLMLVTSAMLVLAAGISEAKAFDEQSNTNHMSTYVDTVIQQVRSKRPVGPVPATLLTGPVALDAHKLARQQHLFDQQIAFIIAHELAHHYRGHTGCVRGRSNAQIQADDISRTLSRTVPIFSQPREVEADMWGMVNVLEAGAQRPGATWNEEGALLNLDFFRRLRQRGGGNLAMLFLSTHPAPQLRVPIVQSISRQWRPGWRPMTTPGSGEGQGIRLPTPAGNLELPIPIPSSGGS